MMPIKNSPTNFIKRILFSVTIEGESAWPALVPSKRYFATCILKPKIGDFIVFKDPKNKEEIFVKKIKSIEGEGYFVEGAVSWASSSKDFGLVPKNFILGKLIFLTQKQM